MLQLQYSPRPDKPGVRGPGASECVALAGGVEAIPSKTPDRATARNRSETPVSPAPRFVITGFAEVVETQFKERAKVRAADSAADRYTANHDVPGILSDSPSDMSTSRLGLAAIALLVSLPFLLSNHTTPIPSFHEEWIAAVLGLLASVALVGARSMPLPGAALLALALAGIALMQALLGNSPVPQLASLYTLYLLWAALLASASRHLAESFGLARLIRMLAAAMLAGSLLAALLSLFDPWLRPLGWIGLPPQKGGALAQVNHFSTYLWLGLASALYLRRTAKFPIQLFWAVSGLLVLTAALAGARASLLYLAALVAIDFWLTRKNADSGPLESRRLVFGIGLLFLLAQPLVPLLPVSSDGSAKAPPVLRIANELQQAPVRLQLWRVGAEGILAAPFFGNGIGSYPGMALAYADRLPPGSNPGSSEHAHNILVELAAELGVPAALLLMLGTGVWLKRLPQSAAPAESHWAGTVIVILGLHSLIEYPLWHTYFLGLVAVVAGAFGPPRALGKKLAPIALTLGLLAWSSLILFELKRDYAQLELAHALGRHPAAMTQAGEALLRIPETSLLVPWVAATSCISLDPLRVTVADGQSVCSIGLAFAPTVQCVVNAGVLKWRAGDSIGAHDLLRRLRRSTRQFGTAEFDALLADVTAREPGLASLLKTTD